MIDYIHNIAFAVLPGIIPTPKSKVPPKPKPAELINRRIEELREELLAIHMERAALRGREREAEIVINELQLSLQFFSEREKQ